MENINKTVARISETMTGEFVITNDALDFIDETGAKHPTRRAAIAAAKTQIDYATGSRAYTHYLRAGNKLVTIK